jgi:hypothetical protein
VLVFSCLLFAKTVKVNVFWRDIDLRCKQRTHVKATLN